MRIFFPDSAMTAVRSLTSIRSFGGPPPPSDTEPAGDSAARVAVNLNDENLRGKRRRRGRAETVNKTEPEVGFWNERRGGGEGGEQHPNRWSRAIADPFGSRRTKKRGSIK